MSEKRSIPPVGLGAFITGIKEEILRSQRESEGDRALFKMETVTVRASVVASEKSGGGIDVKVFSGARGRSQEKAHEVVLTMSFLEEKSGQIGYASPSVGPSVNVQVEPFGHVMTSPGDYMDENDPGSFGGKDT